MSTVTLDLAEFKTLEAAREAAENESAALRTQLVAARHANIDEATRDLMIAFRASLEVVRYATGHLSGEFARKWPLKDLRALTEGIHRLPDVTAHELELATEFCAFADDVARYDAARVERYIPPPADSHGIKHAESPDVDHHVTVYARDAGRVPGADQLTPIVNDEHR